MIVNKWRAKWLKSVIFTDYIVMFIDNRDDLNDMVIRINEINRVEMNIRKTKDLFKEKSENKSEQTAVRKYKWTCIIETT